MSFIDRYDPEQIGRLLVETEVEGDQLVMVLRCPATHNEMTLCWSPVPETESQLEKALLDGFRSVEENFHWDGSRWTWWEANDRVKEFERVFYSQEFDNFDRKVLLTRTLQAVLSADGVESPEERALLNKLCPGFEGMAPGLPLEELAQLPKKVREQVYGLSCAMAWCDFEAAPAEDQILEQLATHLGLTSLRSWSLQEAARHFLIDRRLEQESLQEVTMKARGLGMSPDAVGRLAERHQLRRAHQVDSPMGGETSELLNDWILKG